ncbi:site-specific integrase [Burkholderia multivorans]|uniref:tyrosine-type recombinase/integrase n=1 Tax=Burkholderia multivorans TaxID=87883 RepID=UPI001C22D9AE|nr:site-specific integrase [Burkholderia multivorans]MBU9660925.1 site-specific integrase [Burkholderia multivorans]
MASFRKMASGGWRAEVYVKGVRDSAVRDTKAEAQAWALKRETELRSIATGQGSKTHTVGDVLSEYRDKVSPMKRGERWERLRLDLIGRKRIDGRPFSEIRLADLRPAHIAAWRDARLKEVSPASVNREMTLLSHALDTARREWGWLASTPMKDVKRPSPGPGHERLISAAEIEAITLALGYQEGMPVQYASQRVAVAFLFAIETAMRSGEILGLTSHTVDLKRRVARLPLTKNGSARSVALSTRAIELIEMLPKVEDGVPLFGLTDKTRDALFRKARDKAFPKVPPEERLTFHDTRHEAITRLAKKLQPLDLARMTGHTNLNELLTYYNETAADIAARIG